MKRCCGLLAGALWLVGAMGAAQANPLLEKLISEGVKLSDGSVVKLPAPWLADGLDAAAQKAAIEKVASRYPYDQFTRDSAVAPLLLEMQSIESQGGVRTGQRVDVAFVAYATLELVNDGDMLARLLGVEQQTDDEKGGAVALTAEQLASRGIELAPADGEVRQSLAAVRFEVLDRVEVSGVANTMRTGSSQSLVAAVEFDPRFADDPELPMHWRPIERTAAGETIKGAAQRYSGVGAYVKVTPLVEPRGALLVEAHAVFDEPHGWFGGVNLLRSKLPIVVQDNVRSFRRKLAAQVK